MDLEDEWDSELHQQMILDVLCLFARCAHQLFKLGVNWLSHKTLLLAFGLATHLRLVSTQHDI